MSRLSASIVFLLGCLPAGNNELERHVEPHVRVDLIDGSRIVGQLDRESLSGKTSYGALEIPLQSMHQFQRLRDGRLKISFANGDEMSVEPKFSELKCETIFGEASLKLEHIQRLVVRSQVLQALPARENVVVYFGFDSAEEGRITNGAQDQLHAKNLGAHWTKRGANGGGLEFDGSARLEIPHDKLLCPPVFTFAAWVYPTAESANYEMLIAKTNASSWNGGYGVCRMSGDRDNVRFFINSYTSLYQSRPLPIRRWTHLACVAHGEGIQFYMNGKLMPEVGKKPNRIPNILAARVQHTSTPMTLGGDPSHYGWKGRMDEFVLYNTALSAKQIRQLYTMCAPAELSSDELLMPAEEVSTKPEEFAADEGE